MTIAVLAVLLGSGLARGDDAIRALPSVSTPAAVEVPAPDQGGRWVGISLGVMSANIGGRYAADVNTSSGRQTLPEAVGEIRTVHAMTLLHGAISYRQGLRAAPGLQPGLDLGFAYFRAPSAIRFSTGEQSSIIDGFSNDWGAFSEFDVARVALRPKLYASLGRLHVYAGAAFDFNTFFILVQNHRTTALTDFGQSSGVSTTTVATLRPILGFEAALTRTVALWLESSWQPVRAYGGGDTITVNDINMFVQPAIQHGFCWGFGLKYYFNLRTPSGSAD